MTPMRFAALALLVLAPAVAQAKTPAPQPKITLPPVTVDAPVVRVGAPFTPAPYAPGLESAWVPGAGDVEAAVRRVMNT